MQGLASAVNKVFFKIDDVYRKLNDCTLFDVFQECVRFLVIYRRLIFSFFHEKLSIPAVVVLFSLSIIHVKLQR